MGATGPNVSCLATSISLVTSVTIVGWKNVPPSSCLWPPTRTWAPLHTASDRCVSTWQCQIKV